VIPINSLRLQKNTPLTNGDGVNNEVEPGMTAQNKSLECENKSDPRPWIPSWFQDHEEYRARYLVRKNV